MKTILTSILFAALAAAQPAPRYTITDLGSLGGTYSYVYGINSGQGPLINLGTLGGANSAADGPNASGEVVIGSETAQKIPMEKTFAPPAPIFSAWLSSGKMVFHRRLGFVLEHISASDAFRPARSALGSERQAHGPRHSGRHI